MAVNEVTINGQTVISLVNDTVTEDSLLSGGTAHDASGAQITGKAMYVNPNLIIDPDFSINQRGKSEYKGGETGNGYTVDNWFQYPFYCNVTPKGDGGIILTNTSEAENSYSDVRQSFENPLYEEQLYTLSIKIDGNVYTVTRSLTSNLASNWITDSINVYLSTGAIIIRNFMPGGSANIEWVKLEIGAVATPFVKPDRATELLKCQRYLQFRTTGDIDPIDLRPTMRITPTVTQYDDGRYMYSAEL